MHNLRKNMKSYQTLNFNLLACGRNSGRVPRVILFQSIGYPYEIFLLSEKRTSNPSDTLF